MKQRIFTFTVSYEPEMYVFDVFFLKINSQFVFKHNLNDAVNSISTSKKELLYDTSEKKVRSCFRYWT
ncbi:hypothetical protein GCM10007111_00120 [Virgibacillus kapii]|uniref:Uncharacterized protein n=1 Tax=Virgibacillus kapii TaxID=1638645 RepID=A0ABQ2D5K6_9BACI|nr:hypothetical protein GCM10007111_00120 [Virgibacillus kapii]